MKKQLLTLFFATALLNGFAQGETITTAQEIDPTSTGAETSLIASSTASGLDTDCLDNAGEDTFYKHTVLADDNKLTIGMASGLVVGLGTTVEYQILKGDTNGVLDENFTPICGSYQTVLLLGGSFEEVIENVEEGDVYYLRVFKPEATVPLLGNLLGSLLGVTTITMNSSFDATLSLNTVSDQGKITCVVKDTNIQIHNTGAKSVNTFEIYNITGQLVINNQGGSNIESIDIAALNTGVYILKLTGYKTSKTIKFIKN